MNNAGDIRWHKDRILINVVSRFQELAVELVAPELRKSTGSSFGTWRSENFTQKSFVPESPGDSSELVDEYSGLFSIFENSARLHLLIAVEGLDQGGVL